MNLYWIAVGSLVLFILVGIFGGNLLHLQGTTWWVFFSLMTFLGIVSAALFAFLQYKSNKNKGGAEPGGGNNETDPLIRDANARLAQSKGGAGIANLPMIFVIGDRGTAKTSVLLNSAIEAELLAGQIYQENVVAPTRAANIFFARGTVFVEAGGALMGNPQAWSQLVARLRPGRLKSLAGSGDAPRGVLLCFDLETFARQGAADAIANAARYLHARLAEISQILGVSYPVYVLFTRGDRLPYFADFVRNLSHDEAGQVVGVTLPMLPLQSSGVYGEQETQRLNNAFNQLFHAFCDQRLRLLPRETEVPRLAQAYEFPREFRKLRNPLVQFLVDIGRPSQLRSSPFLRGFYFSGVRPVQMTQAPVTPVVPAAASVESSGATGMFRAGMEAERRAEAMGSAGGTSRKVPQWLFLGHLFNDVILADEPARLASGSSTKTSTMKRMLFAVAAALCLFYLTAATISFLRNRSLARDIESAAQGLTGLTVPPNTYVTEDSLKKLEALRQPLARLVDYETDGAPWSMRWGLYQGRNILPDARRIYYKRFEQAMFGVTQNGLLANLQRTPAAPGPNDDFGYSYDTLKTYLLTTSEWKRSSDQDLEKFLAQRLQQRWASGRESELGQARVDLAKLQFDFYAHDLRNGNPFSPSNDAGAIGLSRAYLAKFSGVERVYRFLIAEGAKKNPTVSFNQKFPGTAEAVSSSVPVEWAYTKDGWKFMQDQIKRQNFGGEPWVLGPDQGAGIDRAAMEKGILDLYTRDYIQKWRAVLQGSNVVRYGSYQDASRKLTLLTGPGAPLLALMWWVSQNTSVDLPGVSEKFRAPQAVVPPAPAQQYIVQQNQSYNGGLMNLQQAVERAAAKDPNGEQSVRDSGQSARLTARQLSATFPPDPEGHVEQRTEILLLQPIAYLDGLAGGDLRSGGARFCQAFNSLTSKFPFNNNADPEISLDDLNGFLRPGSGQLWTAYESTFKSAMVCQNGECAPQGSTPVNPAFTRFVGQLMKFSLALYGATGSEANLRYTLRPAASDQVEEFDIAVNGDLAPLKGGASRQFGWPGNGTRSFRLDLKLSGGGNLSTTYDGPWGLFRFFAGANRNVVAGNGFNFSWAVTSGPRQQPVNAKGRPLTYDFYVETGGGPAVFSKEFLAGLRCPSPVTR